jgi:hypothetical protein
MKIQAQNGGVSLQSSADEYCSLNNLMNEILHGFNPGDRFDVKGGEGEVARVLLRSFNQRCEGGGEMYLTLSDAETLLKAIAIVGEALKGRHLENRVGISHDDLRGVIEHFENALKM